MRIEYIVSIITLLFLFTWLFFPFIYSIYISSFNYILVRPGDFRFVGFNNYITLYTDAFFQGSILITFTYALILLVTEIVVGTLIAYFLSRDVLGISIMRVLIGIPILIIPSASTILWRNLTSRVFGIADVITIALGLGELPWAEDPLLSSILVITVDTWQWIPFVALVLLAAILGLPQEPIEAARVDGLSPWKTFTMVMLPMLTPVIIIIAIIRFLDLLKLLEPILLITKGIYPTISMYVWKFVFKSLNIGLGGAFSVTVWVMVWVIANVLLRVFIKYYRRGG